MKIKLLASNGSDGGETHWPTKGEACNMERLRRKKKEPPDFL
jgi:hypothetical protein